MQRKLLYLYDYRLPDGSAPPKGHPKLDVIITDCHTHLDELFWKYDHSLTALEILMDPPVKLRHFIANYVFPLKRGTMRKHLEMDSWVSATIGVHPDMLFKGTYNGSFRNLEALVNDTPRVVGIGEVDLDYTTACRCRLVKGISLRLSANSSACVFPWPIKSANPLWFTVGTQVMGLQLNKPCCCLGTWT